MLIPEFAKLAFLLALLVNPLPTVTPASLHFTTTQVQPLVVLLAKSENTLINPESAKIVQKTAMSVTTKNAQTVPPDIMFKMEFVFNNAMITTI